MRITFVRPHLHAGRSADAMEPLVFAILNRLTPPDVQTTLHDERLEPIPLDEPTDLVALTVETFTARRAYQIATEYRRRGVKVVMGGHHPTFLPEEALGFADAVVQGDAESMWPRVVADAGTGKLRRLYRQAGFAELGGLQPDRGIFKGKRYAPAALVQYGRGCRFNCDFCSIRAFYGSHLRQRPVGEVVEEIQLAGRKHVFLVDDNLFVDEQRARELFLALKPLGITWSCQVSIDIARNRSLLELMRKSGCTTAVVGFESLSPKNLTQMNKGWNLKWAGYDRSIEILQDAGIMICGTFVFGYDHDTVDAFDEALEFAIRNKFFLANFNPLMPMPGTPLFDRLQRERRLIHDRWWLASDYRYGQATFRPRGMSAEALTAGCYRARCAFASGRSIVRRAFKRRTNARTPFRLGLYLLSNLVSRKEIHRKQGRALGGAAPAETVEEPV